MLNGEELERLRLVAAQRYFVEGLPTYERLKRACYDVDKLVAELTALRAATAEDGDWRTRCERAERQLSEYAKMDAPAAYDAGFADGEWDVLHRLGAATAEAERLREALEEIAVCPNVQEIARAALAAPAPASRAGNDDATFPYDPSNIDPWNVPPSARDGNDD
jgi:putative intracellular protease/amidase